MSDNDQEASECTCRGSRLICAYCKEQDRLRTAGAQVEQRTETINRVGEVYAWSRRDPRADQHPREFRGNEIQWVVRDGATVYVSRGPEHVTEVDRDTFVSAVAIMRHCDHATMTWPFYGRGVTGPGPSPWDPREGWLVPDQIPAELT